MDYNIFKNDVYHLISLFKKIQKQSSEKNDIVLFLQKFDDLDKYLSDPNNGSVYTELLDFEFRKNMTEMLRTFVDRNQLNLVSRIAKFVSSLTEYSEPFSEALAKEDMPDLLISVTIKYGDKTYLSQCNDDAMIDIIVYYILHIIYHIVRHIRFHQYFLMHKHIDRFKQTILPWMSSKNVNNRILATFILTWLMKEDSEDKNTIEKHADVINQVCDYIKVIIKTRERCYHGYSLWELLLGLQALTSIDSIKSEVINVNGFIQSLIDIIKSKLSQSKEVETSLEILWSLTFVAKNREILQQTYHIEDNVKSMTHNSNPVIKKKARGILWELNRKQKDNPVEKDQKYDIFISYSHVQKEPIAKLAAVLKTKFKVWVDIDNLKGSGLDDMATGIEQSSIFMMAVSSSYKQSQCCRSEANWAFKLNKPIIPLIMVHKYSPDGWLGMMISSETYIDFSDEADFTNASEKIIKHVSYKCSQIIKEIEPIHDVSKTSSNDVRKKSIELPENIRDWDARHVTHWLSDHKLKHLQTKFTDFDGGMLLAMKNMMEKTYEKYNDHLEKKFQMSITDILKFDSALASLRL